MRRISALALVLLFAMQSTAFAGTIDVPNVSTAFVGIEPILSAIQGSYVAALVTGNIDRYALMHAPAPTFPRVRPDYTRPDVSSSRFAVRRMISGEAIPGPRMLRPSEVGRIASVDPVSIRNVRVPQQKSMAIPMTCIAGAPAGVRAPSKGREIIIGGCPTPTPTPAPSPTPGQFNVAVSVSGSTSILVGTGALVCTLGTTTCPPPPPGITLSNGTCPGIATLSVQHVAKGSIGETFVQVLGSAIGRCVATGTLSNGGFDTFNITVVAPTPTPVPTATPIPTLPPASTGNNAWWTYHPYAIAGVGKALVNVGTGNLVLQTSDVNVPERGLGLTFLRTYNSQSQHDTSGTDGAPPSVYGNGWTNSLDATIAYDAGLNIMSVYDIDGSRYDFTWDVTGKWVPPAGLQGTTLASDGGCGYQWTQKNGTIYYFFEPLNMPNGPACFQNNQQGYAGRLTEIIGRNHNNYIALQYTWNGNASSIQNVATITAMHSDGQSVKLSFAKFGIYTELSTLTRPDGQVITYSYDATGNLGEVTHPANATDDATQTASIAQTSEQYWYRGYQLVQTASPRYVWSATNTPSNLDGAYYTIGYDGYGPAAHVASINDYAVVDSIPNDGTSTYLQNTPAGIQEWKTESWTFGAHTSTMSDSQGHAATWTSNTAGNVVQTQQYTGSLYLVTSATWNQNLLVSSVDPRGNQTDYTYDINGNRTSMTQPSVTTSEGTGRPVVRYSYDQFNNLTAVCDQEHSWGGSTACAPGPGAMSYTYDFSDSSIEPYGRLTQTTTPMGNHITLSYSTANGDYGLPTSFSADSFVQKDGTTAQEQRSFVYDSYGDLETFSKGYGNYTISYDLLHNQTSMTDPDGVSTQTYYNIDGSVKCRQTSYQYSLDGANCGPHSQNYSYDADGNDLTETHHHGETVSTGVRIGVTTKWYDGEDRLIEVELPSDQYTDNSVPWRTRYIYDLSQNQQVSIVGTGAPAPFLAHGDLYKVENYFPLSGTTVASWNDVSGTATDALGRGIARYQYSPGNGIQAWTASYDAAPYYGLLTSTTDPSHAVTTETYDTLNREQTVTYSDGVTPAASYQFDPDGRLASATSSTFGTDTYKYDADGREVTYQEGVGGGTTSPATVNYDYYPDGRRSSVSVTSAALTQQGEFQYSYRGDGLPATLSVAGQPHPFSWTYTNAGRALTQSDPLTGTTVNNVTFMAKTASYDQFGRLAAVELPAHYQYSNMQYDSENSVVGFNAGRDVGTTPSAYANQVAFTYDVRGELVGLSAASAAAPMQFLGGSDFLYGAACATKTLASFSCSPNEDAYTGAVFASAPIATYDDGEGATCTARTAWSFDLSGRESSLSATSSSGANCPLHIGPFIAEQRNYDAMNRTVSVTDNGLGPESGAKDNCGFPA